MASTSTTSLSSSAYTVSTPTPAIARLYQSIVPQMSNWLPEAEAAQLRLEFESEMARLTSA